MRIDFRLSYDIQTRVPLLRWIFPAAQLMLCAVILWPIRPLLVYQIKASVREYGISHEAAARSAASPKVRLFDLSDPEIRRRIGTSEAREQAVAALNLPGGLPDLTYAILSPAHNDWIPKGMPMWMWRALSWPIVGIFFWWLAGRSTEALLSATQKILLPRLAWWEVALALPVLAFRAMWAVLLAFDQLLGEELRLRILFTGLASIWIVLGASTPLAYFVQWQLRRQVGSFTLEQSKN